MANENSPPRCSEEGTQDTSPDLCAPLLSCCCCSAPVTAAAFYVIKLQGSYGLFYCVYLATLAVGIGE